MFPTHVAKWTKGPSLPKDIPEAMANTKALALAMSVYVPRNSTGINVSSTVWNLEDHKIQLVHVSTLGASHGCLDTLQHEDSFNSQLLWQYPDFKSINVLSDLSMKNATSEKIQATNEIKIQS
ncbi:hypothetical protein WICPIJ_002408 [Wickerhamomyces pijperi]|uniref:Uncharacterized protein n=1 Tax=Wickerhamomyces pijperi TaxID=599730 RepID=A0A9P8QBV7_WICPI|nr:hypothetical protein WICPIJ_002408 [Wickerhamomyces pijperi]